MKRYRKTNRRRKSRPSLVRYQKAEYLLHLRREKAVLEAERDFLLQEYQRLTKICDALVHRLRIARAFVRLCTARAAIVDPASSHQKNTDESTTRTI